MDLARFSPFRAWRRTRDRDAAGSPEQPTTPPPASTTPPPVGPGPTPIPTGPKPPPVPARARRLGTRPLRVPAPLPPPPAPPDEVFDELETALLPRISRPAHRAPTVRYPLPKGVRPGQRRAGPYYLTGLIARGSSADVYRAFDPARGKIVALKRLRGDASPLQQAMLRTEASLLEALDHPNIVRALDHAPAHRAGYFTMEYVDGCTVAALMRAMSKRGIALPMNVCVAIAAEVAAGLHHAHQLMLAPGVPAGIVHRDISAWNILVGHDGSVKIADFGIARIDLHDTSTTSVLAGKPGYMSPEQLRGEKLDGRSDVFSLGVMLWEMTTGQVLFGGDTDEERERNTLNGVAPKPSFAMGVFPQEVERVIMKALAPDRRQRYRSVEAMLVDLLACQCASPSRARSMIAAAMSELIGRR